MPDPARILVIDDSAAERALLQEVLSEEDLVVEVAPDGVSGLERASQESFDCVIVDLRMPRMDGIEVCRRLIGLRRAGAGTPGILMLTGWEDEEEMTRGLAAGADDFVAKSSDTAVLRARLRALLRRKFYQDENQRMTLELRERELETLRARAARDVAEARAALMDRLEAANRELEETNRRLRETQAQLVHSEKMASLGVLVAGIAHEINNPLSFVISNLYTLCEGTETFVTPLADQLSPKGRAWLARTRVRFDDTREGLDRVRDLVQKLRDFSRLDAGVFGTLDVPRSIGTVLRILGDRIRDRIEVHTDYGARPELDCYAGEMNQVLMNLLSNAVDSIEGCGRILVSTLEQGGRYLIGIRDDGRGMPAAVAGRVFDPFFTTKQVGEGIGLGLSVSYGIVQAHGGEIRVSSEPGKGSEFTVSIPLDLRASLRNERGD